jgi:hypothetical protein
VTKFGIVRADNDSAKVKFVNCNRCNNQVMGWMTENACWDLLREPELFLLFLCNVWVFGNM